MRVLHNIGDSFLDFIEENRYGSWLFQAARVGLFAMVLVMGGRVASGKFLAFQWDDVLFIGSGVLGLLLVAWRWVIGLILVVATTAFIIHYRAIPTVSLYHFVPEIRWLEDFRLFLGQALLLYILGLFFLSKHARTFWERVNTPLSTAVMAFMMAVLIAGVSGVVFNEILLKHMIEKARAYSYYLMFFGTLLCIRNRADLKFVMAGLIIMTCVVAIGMVLQFASGNTIRIFIGTARVEGIVGQFATRILPPGQALVWLMIPPLVAVIAYLKGSLRIWVTLALLLTSIGLLLTLTRAMWIGCLGGIILMLIIASRDDRIGIARIFTIFVALIMFLLLLLGAVSTTSENYLNTYVQRFTSIFTEDAYVASSTVGSRLEEIKAAWEHIVVHPWQGIGIGAIYNYELKWNLETYSFEWRGITYIHNVYILVLTKMGLLGLVPLLAMITVYFVRAWRIYQSFPPGVDRALVLGGIGATFSVVVGSNLQPSLASPGPVSVMALMWGATEFLRWWHDTGQAAAEQQNRTA